MVILQGFKTPVAADLAGGTYTQLINLIRGKKIKPPVKDSSGDYLWSEADVEAARQALAARRRPAAVSAEGGGHAA